MDGMVTQVVAGKKDEIKHKDSQRKEMEQGLKGGKLALKILNEHYAQADRPRGSSDGAGGGIAGMLEVIESDLTKGITEMVVAESRPPAPEWLHGRECCCL